MKENSSNCTRKRLKNIRTVRTSALFSLLASIMILWMSAPAAAETQVSISATDNSVYIGDDIQVKVLVKTTDDVREIKLNTHPNGPNDFEINSEKNTEKRPQKDYNVFEKTMIVAFYKTGDFNIGPFQLSLIGQDGKTIETKETNSIPVTVKTTLKAEDKDIKPLKNLVDIKGDPLYILKYVLIALAIILLIIVFVWQYKKRKKIKEAPVPVLSPLEEFESHVKTLWDKRLFDAEHVKIHFFELTQIIKHFLFRNYGFNAEDFTTYETLYFLKKYEKDTTILNHIQFLCDTADLVKFAKYLPDSPLLNDVLKRILDTIQIYKHRIELELQKQAQEQKQNQTQIHSQENTK